MERKGGLDMDMDINVNVGNSVATTGKSYFDGGLLQLVGWSILGALITGVTLGICYPWALCMVFRWKLIIR